MLHSKRAIVTDRELWLRLVNAGYDHVAYFPATMIGERDWRWAEVFAFNEEAEKKYVEKTLWDNFYRLDMFRGETRKVLIGTTDELAEAFGIKTKAKVAK